MHGTSKKALSFRGRVGVDGSKFTTFHVVSRILCDDEPANLTHASMRSLHTPVRFEKIGELGRFAADLLQYWVSIKRGTTTILKCTGVQNDCTHLTKNRNRRSGCRYHNWPFFKSKVYYIKIQVGNIAFVNGNNWCNHLKGYYYFLTKIKIYKNTKIPKIYTCIFYR